MLVNGETPAISTYPFNSISLMVINGTIENVEYNRYIAIDTEIEYTQSSGGIIIGIVKSYNSIYDTVNNELVEVSIGSKVRVIETGFSGTTVAIASNGGNNINILYDAKDVQRHASITNADGFSSTSDSDYSISNGTKILLAPQSGVVDGLSFWWSDLLTLPIDAADELPRIDLIILEKDQEKTTINVVVKKGTPASSPTTPSVEQTVLGFYELPIMSVYVNANSNSISIDDVTDLRNLITKEQVAANTTVLDNTKLVGMEIAIGSGAAASGGIGSAVGANNTSSGLNANAFGVNSKASGENSSAFGVNSTVFSPRGLAVGYENTAGDSSNANSNTSAVGYWNTASGIASQAMGWCNTASSTASSAFGVQNTASTNSKVSAVGNTNTASGSNSNAFGNTNTASGSNSNAFGYYNKATGSNSNAFGRSCTAAYDYATAIGYNTTVGGATRVQTAQAMYALSFNSTSDRRDKDDIEDISISSLDFIKRIKSRQYVWNERNLYIDDEKEALREKTEKLRERQTIEVEAIEVEYQNEISSIGSDNSKVHSISSEIKDRHEQDIARLKVEQKAELEELKKSFTANFTNIDTSSKKHKGKRKHLGFVAQEIKEVLDEMSVDFGFYKDGLYNDEEDQQSLDYLQFIPILVNAIQELSSKNDRLETTVKSQENRLTILEAKLETLEV